MRNDFNYFYLLFFCFYRVINQGYKSVIYISEEIPDEFHDKLSGPKRFADLIITEGLAI